MEVTVTWDEHRTCQAVIEVPDGASAEEIMLAVSERARQGGGKETAVWAPELAGWETRDRRRFGGRIRT